MNDAEIAGAAYELVETYRYAHDAKAPLIENIRDPERLVRMLVKGVNGSGEDAEVEFKAWLEDGQADLRISHRDGISDIQWDLVPFEIREDYEPKPDSSTPIAGSKYPGIRLENGTLLFKVEVIDVRKDGLKISHSRGTAFYKYTELLPEFAARHQAIYGRTISERATAIAEAEKKKRKADELAKRETLEKLATEERSSSNGAPTRVERQTDSDFSGWNKWSDGRTWNAAPDPDKRALCRGIAANSRKGNSANFYYKNLCALYDTSDKSILDVKLDDSVTAIEAMSPD